MVIILGFEFTISSALHEFFIEPTTVTVPPLALTGSKVIELRDNDTSTGPILEVPNSFQPAGIDHI